MITPAGQVAAEEENTRRRLRDTARPEQGSGTIYVLALTAVVVLVATAGLAVGQAVVARHRAAAAADLSAISAATRVLWEGQAGACHEAVRVASAQGAKLSSCRIDGEVAVVEVEVTLSGPLAAFSAATGRARAGPTSSSQLGPASG